MTSTCPNPGPKFTSVIDFILTKYEVREPGTGAVPTVDSFLKDEELQRLLSNLFEEEKSTAKKSPAKKQSGGSCGKALGNTHGGDAAEVAEETGGMGSRDSGVQPDSPAMANEMVGGRRRRKSGKKSKKSKKAKKGGKTKKAGKKSRKNKKSRKSRK